MSFSIKKSDFIFIFPIGAAGYSLLEVLWRGYTHWTMAPTGGICLWLIYLIFGRFKNIGVIRKCLLCSCAVTVVEFAVGCTVNLLFNMNVWDYSSLPMNVLGQICLPYSLLWMLLCLPLSGLCLLMSKGIRKVERS